jgi:hypothetical protein
MAADVLSPGALHVLPSPPGRHWQPTVLLLAGHTAVGDQMLQRISNTAAGSKSAVALNDWFSADMQASAGTSSNDTAQHLQVAYCSAHCTARKLAIHLASVVAIDKRQQYTSRCCPLHSLCTCCVFEEPHYVRHYCLCAGPACHIPPPAPAATRVC